MCGISGFVSLNGSQNIDPELMKEMNRQQSHRGPDAEGYYFDSGIALSHRRLSIIDVESGQQPMFSDDGQIVIVFNGEIYNYLKVNALLKERGHQFNTQSDTETIIRSYQEWGVECLEYLKGMFAFVLYDKQNRSIFVARDRVGEKPLYYSVVSGNFIFASELKVLKKHPEITSQLCPKAVEDFHTFGYVPENKSIFKQVKKLLPAHYLYFHIGDSNTLDQECYWDLPDPSVAEKPSTTDLYNEFKQVVGERMMSEVPLGAFLSGGVDSSGVVAAMAQLSEGERVTTCSIGFDVPEYNESDFAEAVAERYGTNHHLDIVNHDDFSLIDKLAGIYDEPFADSSAIPTFKVCEVAKKYVTVCLSGDAGDEIFAGYRRYKLHQNEEKVRSKVPLFLRRVIFSPLAKLYPKADWAPRFLRAKTTFQSLSMPSWKGYLNSVSKIREDERSGLYSSIFKSKLDGYSSQSVFYEQIKDRNFTDFVKEAQYLDFKTWMPSDILVKVDRASMANSLEVRVPMLDHDFLEKYFCLPTYENLKGNEGKSSLKEALVPHLPHENLYREKMGFSIPLSEWLRGPLRDKLWLAVSNDKLKALDIFEFDKLKTMFQLHQDKKRDYGAELWTIFIFSLFVQENDAHW